MGELKEKPAKILRTWASNDSLDEFIAIAIRRVYIEDVKLDGCIWHGRWWRRLHDQLNSNFKNQIIKNS